ncbi:MAG TPA: nucleotidyltransferase [Planctomycetes bacterium]|nr:nucleotidyltransferase [Planctomycetota bacterium]
MMNHEDLLTRVTDAQPYPLLFATLSGAHLYGFASADSDYDLRAVHVLPAEEILGLRKGPSTIDETSIQDGIELDFVSHDAEKFFGLMLRRNGYVLEQIFSPLVIHGGDGLERLRDIGGRCITRHHAHHYLGFAANQWKLFRKESSPRVKPLLYTYRVLLTGIHLMRTGNVEANLLTLNEDFKLSFLADLVALKQEGAEKGILEGSDLEFHTREYAHLTALLEAAYSESTLPEAPTATDELHDYLLELRLQKQEE